MQADSERRDKFLEAAVKELQAIRGSVEEFGAIRGAMEELKAMRGSVEQLQAAIASEHTQGAAGSMQQEPMTSRTEQPVQVGGKLGCSAVCLLLVIL